MSRQKSLGPISSVINFKRLWSIFKNRVLLWPSERSSPSNDAASRWCLITFASIILSPCGACLLTLHQVRRHWTLMSCRLISHRWLNNRKVWGYTLWECWEASGILAMFSRLQSRTKRLETRSKLCKLVMRQRINLEPLLSTVIWRTFVAIPPLPAVSESPMAAMMSMSPGRSLWTDVGTVSLLRPGPLTSQKNDWFGANWGWIL